MAQARTFQHMDRETLRRKVETKGRFHLWNVLSKEWFKAEENIPGSKWVPVDRLEEKLPTLNVKKDEEIVVYCGGVQCPQSGQAAQKLVDLGFTRVSAFEGGLKEWKEAGLPLETLPQHKGESGSSCCSA